MDALDALEQMHEQARAEFARLETTDSIERAGAWARLRTALKLHEQIEETFVYDPVVEEVGDIDRRLDEFHAQHELEAHHANQAMDRIGDLDPTDPQWIAEIRRLHATLAEHMSTEEEQFWPVIRERWGDRKLQDAGRAVGLARAAGEAGGSIAEALGAARQALVGG